MKTTHHEPRAGALFFVVKVKAASHTFHTEFRSLLHCEVKAGIILFTSASLIRVEWLMTASCNMRFRFPAMRQVVVNVMELGGFKTQERTVGRLGYVDPRWPRIPRTVSDFRSTVRPSPREGQGPQLP